MTLFNYFCNKSNIAFAWFYYSVLLQVTNTAAFMNYLEITWTQQRLDSTKWMQCNRGPSQFKNWFLSFC